MKSSAATSAPRDYPVGEFRSVFTGSEPFLADHVIQGQRILPGMAYLEIARAAVAASISLPRDSMLVLSNSVFVNALTVREQRSVVTRVYPGAAGSFGVEVSTEQGVHFQSKVSVQKKREFLAAKGHAPQLDIALLREECTLSGPTKAAFYERFSKRGVDLGPSHRGVEEIWLDGKGAGLAKIRLPGAAARGMAMDAGMLDSIIQSGIALVSNPEANVVPFAVSNTLVLDALADTMMVYIRQHTDGMHYIAADESGNVRVIIEGFQTREIDLNARQDRVSFYLPEWKVTAAPARSDAREPLIVEAGTDYVATTKALLDAARSLLQDRSQQHVIELRAHTRDQCAHGLWAALRTIAMEHSHIDFRLKVGNDYLSLEHTEATLDSRELAWPNGKKILISGGLGALGFLVARDIAEHSLGSTLILLGRRPPNGSDDARIQALKQLGADVVYRQCDVAQLEQVEAIVAEHPDIQIVVHAAGLIDDAWVAQKSGEAVDRVLGPKVRGIENLDRATAACQLEYFVAFSSVAGALGNPGQFDYAAANGYMDAYIEQRAQRAPGRSISINWPLWEEGGMQLDAAARETLARTFAIKPLPSSAGLAALRLIMASSHSRVLPLYGQKHLQAALFAPPKTASEPQHSSVELDKLQRDILQDVRLQAAQHLKLKPNQLNDSEDWTAFGFDSILISSFVTHLNHAYDLNLMPTAMFEASNLLRFSRFLAENHASQMMKKLAPTTARGSAAPAKPLPRTATAEAAADDPSVTQFARRFHGAYKSQRSYRDEDIAVIGMSCRVAGAEGPDEFWRMLDEGRDTIREIPPERWNWRDYPGVSKWGSFIDGMDEFDPLFFGISPAEAAYMNPEQRLMMQYVWKCIEDAGYGGDSLKGTNTGIFIGCGPSSYASLMSHLPIEAYSVTGNVSSVGPNRISYYMDWHGASNPIDTACSSSLVAVHRAVEALRQGHCDQAIIGGVNALLGPDVYVSFTKSGMLCEDGRCKTFSDKANGYVRGEGVGMLMLKPLAAARRDGDDIYAVIKGAAENHGGRTTSLTAPNPNAQAAVIKKAIEDAGIDFRRVGYIECHGTGTELGDPVEVRGLKAVAKELLEAGSAVEKQQTDPCYLGSIKSNIGHLEYAAGVVGLIKAILQIRHRRIAQSLHCERISPLLDLSDTPYKIAQQACDWIVAAGQSRIAGVSSFGFGGANAHVVVEEYIEPDSAAVATTDSAAPQLLVFSARNADALYNTLRAYPSFLRRTDPSPLTLQRIAYTLQTGRAEMQERVAFVANTIEEWSELLEGFLQERENFYHRKVFRGSVKLGADANLDVGDTQAGQEFMQRLVETREVEKLAELWVKGSKLDWQLLHA
ncbi:SDR family NAD(P)-dependent oxidoreductase [Steroidobacter sp. S1-65]|uniref:SDR family NAD(P)-dependent oxidoreductase n=1 Tax=Steroidobacter gossypii TaxID=2805490 RepID=A0ABS1WUC9_9GAMM|nr:SDR family NAD(P)-dependent oxidoreductase [Steroidobacter gossypii]MBM0104581.1 SDR family NAD(P)-dependent oxidoreductase [Steroidobacter gossypii]